MAQPLRKHQELEFKKPSDAASDNPEIPESANENESSEEFKNKLANDLKTNRDLEAHRWDILAMYSIRMHFPSLKNKNPENLNFYCVHPEYNVAIARAFKLKDSENILALEDSRAKARMFEQKSGIRTIKGNAERHELDEKANMVVVLDDDVKATKYLLKNIVPGGWIVCRIGMANALRAKYKFMGVVERGSGDPHVKEYGDEYWEKSEVTSLSAYNSAPAVEGMATKAEMEFALKNTGRKSSGDVVKAYRELLTDAREQGHERTADGKLVYIITDKNGAEERCELNPLPMSPGGHDDDIVIMKKRTGALV